MTWSDNRSSTKDGIYCRSQFPKKKKERLFCTYLWSISWEEWRLQKMIGKIKLNKKRVGETSIKQLSFLPIVTFLGWPVNLEGVLFADLDTNTWFHHGSHHLELSACMWILPLPHRTFLFHGFIYFYSIYYQVTILPLHASISDPPFAGRKKYFWPGF